MISKHTRLKEIATALGVAISTVSRALQDHPTISQKTKNKVRQLAREMDYEPNHAAVSLRKGKSYTIGLIVPEIKGVFFSALIKAIEDEAANNGYMVLMGQSHSCEEREAALVCKMINFRVDGLLVSTDSQARSSYPFDMLKRYQIPLIFLVRGATVDSLDHVLYNVEKTTRDVFEFLMGISSN
ncbi:LacI family DNA-binding transcriptional regulator [Pedobacter sp. ISL-68]|uniref:LacI family DNA-binding transcriptional regulator n=1 Tax=unclassified Pedobacter TaxID=2628915 RepID=UPI001BEAB23C|nr:MULTISPECIES: LacI family DNA-binding transcriptional regulator [unclassified Pedobacter]MBT2563127.1 LacI family DNA-binding transcriptional regulator [Pedobacter sp. ISL-64]MBT2593465.1 LacI family DNA-binding transcriptional regulator [Pedobacter sp. ISL-68]